MGKVAYRLFYPVVPSDTLNSRIIQIMGAFQENIAEAVKRELRDPRFQSGNGLDYPLYGGGRVFFVLKTGATNYAQFAEDHPDYKSGDGVVTVAAVYNTVDAAIGACTASQGDVVYVMPGHTETISAAGGVTADIAGVSIIGLGNGSDRPTFTFSATTSTFVVSAANVLFKNLVITSSVNELVKVFNITGAYCTIDAVDVKDGGSAKEIIQFALTTNAADWLTIQNCTHFQLTAAASAQLWIALVGTEGARILNNTFILKLFDHATSSVINADADSRLTEIRGNRGHITGYSAALVSAVIGASGATGINTDNRWYADAALTTTINDTPSMPSFEVYCSNDLDKNGILDPVVGS